MKLSKKFLFGFLALTVFLYFISAFVFYIKTPIGVDKDMLLEVKKGDSAARIMNVLQEKGLIRHKFYFKVLVKLKGRDRVIEPGFYSLKKQDSPETFWDKFINGDVEKNKLTIPEGYTMYQIAKLIESQEMGKRDRFLKLVRDKKFIKSLNMNVPTLEGYLFATTYNFDLMIKEEDMVREMVKKTFDVLYHELMIPEKTSPQEIHRLLTLASLVEREANVKSEMPLISAVFTNRMNGKTKMKLQCDPTVIYGLKKFNGNLTKKDLLTDHPYNTYTRFGLPPTPIANPSREAIASAMNPAAVNYLYFVSKNNGTHFFSSTLKVHNQAVNIYQKKKRRKGA